MILISVFPSKPLYHARETICGEVIVDAVLCSDLTVYVQHSNTRDQSLLTVHPLYERIEARKFRSEKTVKETP